MTNKYIKNCSISSSVGETQIKTMMRFHPTPVRIAFKKKKMAIDAGEYWRKRNLITLLGEYKIAYPL